MIYIYVSDYDQDAYDRAVAYIEAQQPGAVLGRTYRRLNAQIYTDGMIPPGATMVIIDPRFEMVLALANRLKYTTHTTLEVVELPAATEIATTDEPARRGPGRPPKDSVT